MAVTVTKEWAPRATRNRVSPWLLHVFKRGRCYYHRTQRHYRVESRTHGGTPLVRGLTSENDTQQQRKLCETSFLYCRNKSQLLFFSEPNLINSRKLIGSQNPNALVTVEVSYLFSCWKPSSGIILLHSYFRLVLLIFYFSEAKRKHRLLHPSLWCNLPSTL